MHLVIIIIEFGITEMNKNFGLQLASVVIKIENLH